MKLLQRLAGRAGDKGGREEEAAVAGGTAVPKAAAAAAAIEVVPIGASAEGSGVAPAEGGSDGSSSGSASELAHVCAVAAYQAVLQLDDCEARVR